MKNRFNRFVDRLQKFLQCESRAAVILFIIPLYTEIPAIFLYMYLFSTHEHDILSAIAFLWIMLCLVLNCISRYYEFRK